MEKQYQNARQKVSRTRILFKLPRQMVDKLLLDICSPFSLGCVHDEARINGSVKVTRCSSRQFGRFPVQEFQDLCNGVFKDFY